MKSLIFLPLFAVLFFISCEKSLQSQIDEYILFYYPTTSQYFYEISFDWGYYIIDTGPALDEVVHKDSEPYKGFITLRPKVTSNAPQEKLATYLITPQGEVWKTFADDIPESSSREEVVEEKTEYGTSTSTTTINSTMEPVVNHFKTNKNFWQKYANIEGSEGNYSLKKVN